MTNSEKIKAYLDAGHKVKVGKYIIYGHITDLNDDEESFFISDSGLKIQNLPGNISIRQEPLRYPKVGDKVVIVGKYKNHLGDFSNKVVQVTELGSDCTVVSIDDGVCFGIDYRHIAPYIK